MASSSRTTSAVVAGIAYGPGGAFQYSARHASEGWSGAASQVSIAEAGGVVELRVRRPLPLVDHPLAVDVEPHAVVGQGGERVSARAEPLRLRPLDREAVVR